MWKPGLDGVGTAHGLMNIQRLADDIYCVYLFGAVDQLKLSVLAKVKSLQEWLDA